MPLALARVLIVLSLLVGMCPQARAQDLEPNDSCALAGDLGPVEFGPFLTGGLDARPEPVSDVDLFRLTGAPGSSVTVFAGDAGIRARFGVFDEQCTLLQASTELREIRFDVPA